MKLKYIYVVFLMFLACSTMFADGLLVSSDTSYPGYLLRNRVSEVSVKP